ncbi:MAG: helix-turn-helix transcriptional regulator [Sulfolobaceae archaeon]
MKVVHNISKEARSKIIMLLLENRSKESLARELGITSTAINKFLKGITHPSDNTIIKAINIATEDEKVKIYKIIINDLITSLKDFLNTTEIPNKDKILKEEIISKLS